MDADYKHSIVSTLAAQYPVFAVSTIERWVADTIDSFASARIKNYIPILVQRSVGATLSELARLDGTSADLLSVTELTERRRRMVVPEFASWPASRSVPASHVRST